jgi:hypothetical protein
LGQGVPVRWIWRGNEVFREAQNERYNVRNNTLYEEMSPAMQTRILDLLLARIEPIAQAAESVGDHLDQLFEPRDA